MGKRGEDVMEVRGRSFLYPEHSFVVVPRIPRTRFAKQMFAQLRTNYVYRIFLRFDEYPELGLRSHKTFARSKKREKERLKGQEPGEYTMHSVTDLNTLQ